MDMKPVEPHSFFAILEYIAWAATGVAVFLATFLKYLKKRKKTDDGPKPPSNYGQALFIRDLLIELRTETRADRAQIHLFHNGDKYKVNNTSIQKFSCAFEVIGTGVAPASEFYEGRLISSYIDGLEKFVENPGQAVRIGRNTLPDCMYKTTMISTGSYWHVGIALIWDNQIIGFLLVAYNDENHKPKECSFRALKKEGGTVDSKTAEYVPKKCDGTCPDCRYKYYVPRIEELLARGK